SSEKSIVRCHPEYPSFRRDAGQDSRIAGHPTEASSPTPETCVPRRGTWGKELAKEKPEVLGSKPAMRGIPSSLIAGVAAQRAGGGWPGDSRIRGSPRNRTWNAGDLTLEQADAGVRAARYRMAGAPARLCRRIDAEGDEQSGPTAPSPDAEDESYARATF